MINESDFVIENGMLTKYTGSGGDVIIPEGVTSIGDRAFSNCSSLTSVIIPDGVTAIRNGAFEQCLDLKSVTIPDSVTAIGAKAFYNCGEITFITSDPNQLKLVHRYDFRVENGVLVEYRGPGGHVEIPAGVTAIGEAAFAYRSGLISVDIPKGVTAIGNGAFRQCCNLRNVTIPEGVVSIDDNTFSFCNSLTAVTIPDSVTTIGESAFVSCGSLTSLKIPNGVTTIGETAFSNCSGLTNLEIPDSVSTIGQSAFSGCRGLADEEGFVIIRGILFGYFGNGGDVSIPDKVKIIERWALSHCSTITGVTIPASVEAIGEEAFSYCYGLKSLVVLSGIKLTKDIFEGTNPERVVVDNLGLLPAEMKAKAAISFAEEAEEMKTERSKKHLKYIKSNAAKLVSEAMAHPALVRLMCDNKLLSQELTEMYLSAAQEKGNAEIIAMLLAYRENK